IISRAVVDAYLSKTDDSPDLLTSRERQGLQLVGEGKSTKEVGQVRSEERRVGKELMIHRPTAISIYECLSMVQLMAVFISMRCTLCGHFLQVALTLILVVGYAIAAS